MRGPMYYLSYLMCRIAEWEYRMVWSFSCSLNNWNQQQNVFVSLNQKQKINTLTTFRPTQTYRRRLIVSHLLPHNLSERDTQSAWNFTVIYTASLERDHAVSSVQATASIWTVFLSAGCAQSGDVDDLILAACWIDRLAGQPGSPPLLTTLRYVGSERCRADRHSRSIIYDFVCRCLGYFTISCRWWSTADWTDAQLIENKCAAISTSGLWYMSNISHVQSYRVLSHILVKIFNAF